MEQHHLRGQIGELQHITSTKIERGERDLRERIHVFWRVVTSRLYGATSEHATPDYLVKWTRWVLEEIVGPEFLWSYMTELLWQLLYVY